MWVSVILISHSEYEPYTTAVENTCFWLAGSTGEVFMPLTWSAREYSSTWWCVRSIYMTLRHCETTSNVNYAELYVTVQKYLSYQLIQLTFLLIRRFSYWVFPDTQLHSPQASCLYSIHFAYVIFNCWEKKDNLKLEMSKCENRIQGLIYNELIRGTMR